MVMKSQKITDLSEDEFHEMVADLRYCSLRSSNLSSNVAMAFLTNIPAYTKVDSLNMQNTDMKENGQHYEIATAFDQENYLDFDYDEFDQKLAAADALGERTIGAYQKDSKSEFNERTICLKSRISRWKSMCINKLLYLCKRRHNISVSIGDVVENEDENNENDTPNKRKKFYISYSALIVPSDNAYNPNLLNIPILYGFHIARKSATTMDSPDKLKTFTEEIKSSELYSTNFETSSHVNYLNSLNKTFREKHGWLHPTLSFTKLCRIKLILLSSPRVVELLDPSTAACAWTFFERLVVKGTVTKHNRKLYAATCLILAYKFNQDGEHDVINYIIAHLKKDRSITPKLIFSTEMKIFTLLDFSLKQSYSCIKPAIYQYLELCKTTFDNVYDISEDIYIQME